MKLLPLGKTLLNVVHNNISVVPFSVLCRTEYTSAISLKNLYPGSGNTITTPSDSEINEKSKEKFSGYIPLDQIKFTYYRSRGPGGQHVNKTNTKVILRINLASADWLHEDVKNRLIEIKKNKLTKEGDLIIRSDKTRSQELNKADVMQRLRTIIYNAMECIPTEPSPESEERIRQRKEAANRERLRTKRLHSLKLQMGRETE